MRQSVRELLNSHPEPSLETPLSICSNGNVAKYDIFKYFLKCSSGSNSLKILDVGCGAGRQWEWLSKVDSEIRQSLEVIGFEPNARRDATKQIPIVHDINDPSLEEVYDVVVSMSVLEHVYDRRAFIEFCASKANSASGVVIINYDNGHFFGNREWKSNTLGRFLGKNTPIKKWYQDFVDYENILELAEQQKMRLLHESNYHQFSRKGETRRSVSLISDAKKRIQVMELWSKYDRSLDEIFRNYDIDITTNNSSDYSTTLWFEKL